MRSQSLIDRLEGQGLGLLVERDGKLLFASDRDPLVALQRALFTHAALLDGAEVALPAVGLAAAYLLTQGNVGRVFCRYLSQEARGALDEEGIEHEALQASKRPPDALAGPMAALDARARSAVTAAAFVEELKRTRE